MTRTSVFAAAVIFVLAATAPMTFAEWENSLKPAGKPAPPLTIVKDGQGIASIVIPAYPSTQEQKAADDLQQWITQATGVALQISSKAPTPVISITTRKDLADEEYAIIYDEPSKSIHLIGGGGRGVINAVYALLEEDAGFRWYTNDSIRIPQNKTLTLQVVPRHYKPQLMLRDPFYFASFDPVWSLRNRTNAPDAKVSEDFGGHVDYDGMFVHTAATLLPPDQYFKEHPEYFAMDKSGKRYPAQLCPTEPKTVEIVIENVLKTLKENPHTEIISVSKNDSGGDQLCYCDRCKKLREEEGGTEMANQLHLVNQVAEAVEKEYPNVWIDTLAYLDTVHVPKTIRPRHNVIVRLCNDTVGAWARPFTPARELPVAAITQEWSAACEHLSIWDYNINFSHFLAPMPNMDIIADNIRFWCENHAIGVMTQGGYQSTSERDEMRSWVIAKLMWDPSRDEKALERDFIEGHYGSAAPMLEAYEDLLASSRKEHASELANPPGGIRYPMTIAMFSKDFLEKASDIFARAEHGAGSDAKLLHRVERAELPILYVKLAQGPVTKDLLDRFETIAKREKVDWLLEWQVRLDKQLADWRKQISKAEAVPAAAMAAASAPSTQPIVISHGDAALSYQAFPDACRLKNGDIVAVFYAGYTHASLSADDCPLGGRICMVRSSDEGRTWSSPQVLFDDEDDDRDPHIAQLNDGTLVCTFFAWHNTGPRLKSHKDFSWDLFHKQAKLVGAQIVRSHDNGQTWDKSPQLLFPGEPWVCSAPVRQLKDGTCILGLYGSDKADKVNIGATTRSEDGGLTWQEPVLIHAPPGVSLDAETDLIQLKDGKLFAALRSSKQDMHFTTSEDEGKSWSPASDAGFKGHCPHLNRLSTGEIILSHRVPNTSIHISRDDAKTWQGPYEMDSCIGAYPATVELKDGSVLIVYYTEGEGSVIRARRFKVKPDGIEFLSLEK